LINKHQEIIDKLYSLYKSKGFIREEEALDLMAENNISLQDIQRLTGILLGMGAVFADDAMNDDENSIDKSRTDYEMIYDEVMQIAPGLEAFIGYIRNIRPPQWKEWRILIPQAKVGNKYAINRLFEMYLRVVVKIALYSYKRCEYELEELLQEGAIGLLQAIRCYDSSVHDSFVAYFPFWVKQRINRAISNNSRIIRIPVHLHEMMIKFQSTVNKIKLNMGRLPSIEEISKEMGLTLEKTKQIQSYFFKIESYEDYIALHSNPNYIGHDLVDNRPFTDVEKKLIRDAITSALNKLTNREAFVLRMRFGIDDGRTRTLEEVGTAFNVTRERIRQIEAKAIRKLRHPNKKLKKYLEFMD
jgi:RNA polymerase primary sigma factor